MSSQNKFVGKEYSGTFVHGQGPVLGQKVTSESETKGVFGGEGAGRHLSQVSGKAPEVAPKGSDNLFDLHSKSYAGPGNLAFKPEDKGEVSNQPK